MSIEKWAERIALALEKLANAFGKDPADPRYPPPAFPCGPVASPTVPIDIPYVPVPYDPDKAPRQTSTFLPWNGMPGEGAHVECWTRGTFAIRVPAGFEGRRELDISQIPPGGFDACRISIDGVPLDIPFAGGLVKTPILIGPVSVLCEVEVFPAGLGCSLQLR